MPDGQDHVDIGATILGLAVPASPYLHAGRIARIEAGKYEGPEIAGALHVLEADDVVLEIGAGLGIVGGVVALMRKPRRVLSFEANPELIDVARQLYSLNDLTEVVDVQNAVLISAPDRPASIPFYLHKSYLGSSLTDPGPRLRKTVDVPTRDFNSVCAGLAPTVLIMDIEGGELDLLRHADLSPFRAIVVEFHPGVYGAEGMRTCKDILRGQGFRRVEAVSTRTVWTCQRLAQT
ncbi:MAG: FkbM family methyltransferase [Marinibacterium sp.]